MNQLKPWGCLKLLLDLARTPLLDTYTKERKVNVSIKEYNDPFYLVINLINDGIYDISVEELQKAKTLYKIDYKWEAKLFFNELKAK